MSRTYANFLLFENVLDNLPDGTGTIMQQAVQMLSSPIVKVVEENCCTLLGKVVTVNYELEGMIDLATDTPISRLTQLYF